MAASFEDAFGRIVNGISGLTNTTAEVRDMLRTLMTGNVGKESKYAPDAGSASTATKPEKLSPSIASIQTTLDNWFAAHQQDSAKLERIAAATETINRLVAQISPGHEKDVADAKLYADAAVEVKNGAGDRAAARHGSFGGGEGVKMPLIKSVDTGGAGDEISALEELVEKSEEMVEKGKVIEKMAKDILQTKKDMHVIKKEATTVGSLYVADSESHRLLGEILAAIKACCPGSGGAPAVAAAGGAGGSPAAAAAEGEVHEKSLKTLYEEHKVHMQIEDDLYNNAKAAEKQYAFFSAGRFVLTKISQGLQHIESSILAAGKTGKSAFDMMFGGILKDEMKFYRDIRQTAFELQGVTGESKNIQKEWANIGKTVAATGVDRTAFQQAYLKNLKGGVRDLKQAHALTVNQLNTEKQLGLEAGSLSEEFLSWTKAGRMTVMQTAEMGRSMRDIARTTGLTGENLKRAVGASQELIVNLRNAAQLTAASAKNVMEIVANAQKLGVTPQVNKLLSAMTSTANLLTQASSETSGFLLIAASRAGKVKDLMEGTITRSKSGMKDMVKGMEGILKSFGVQSLESIDQLPDEVKFRLNLNLKSAFGMELGEIRNVIQSFKEASKGLGDRLDDINKKRKENLTLEEKAALLEQERALKTTASLSMLTALDEAAKGAQNMDQALAKFGARRKEFEGDLNAMGYAWTSNADAAKGAIEESLKNINTGLAKAGKQQLKISTKDIEEALKDPTKFRELGAQLSKGEQELATAQKAQADPISRMSQGMMELNDTLRNFSSKAITALLALVGSTGLMLTLLAAWAARSYIAYQYIMKSGIDFRGIPIIGKSMNKLFNPEGEKRLQHDQLRQKSLQDLKTQADARKVAPVTGAPAPTKGPAGLTGVKSIAVHDRGAHGLLRLIRACVCKMGGGPGAATGGAGAPAPGSGYSEKYLKRQEILQRRQMKITKAQVAGLGKGGGAIGAPMSVGPSNFASAADNSIGMQLKSLTKNIPDLIKGAAALALAAVAIIALAVVVLKIGGTIAKYAGFDTKKALETGATIAAILASAAIIAAAAIGAAKGLQYLNTLNLASKKMAWDLFRGALTLAILAPAIIALAVVILKMAQAIMKFSGMDMGVAMKTAKALSGVMLAAGIIAVEIAVAAAALYGISQLNSIAPGFVGMIYAGLWSLLLIMPAVMALMATLRLFVKFIEALWSVSEAEKAVKLVTAAFGAMMLTMVGIATGAAILGGIGYLISQIGPIVPLVYAGIWAILLMMPAIMALFLIVTKFVDFIAALWTVEKSKAAIKLVSNAFAAMMLTMTGIATGAAILGGVGYLISQVGPIVGFIYAGIWAILLMMPAIMALFLIVTKFVDFIAALWTVEKAKTAVTLVSNAFMAMGLTALGIIAGGAALGGLGALGMTAMKLVGAVWLGIGAILLMMPPIKILFYVIKGFIEFLQEMWTVAEAKAASTLVLASFEALGITALGIVAGGAALAGFGYLGWTAALIVGACWLGIIGIGLMMPPIYMLFQMIKGFIDFLSEMWSVEEANKATELVQASFEALGLTAIGIAAGGAMLAGFAYLGATAILIVALAWLGYWGISLIMPAIKKLTEKIVEFIHFLADQWTVEEAKMAVQLVDASFEAIGATVWGIAKSAMQLIALNALTGIMEWIFGTVETGRKAFNSISKEIGLLVKDVIKFITDIADQWTVQEAAQGAKLVESTFEAVSTVVWGVFKAGSTLQIMSKLSGFMSWLFGTVKDGRKAFNDMKTEIGGLIKEIIKFITDIADQWTVQEAQQGAKLVEATFEAVSTVVWGVFKAGSTLQIMSKLSGFMSWLFGTVADGREAFNEIKKEIEGLVKDVIKFVSMVADLWTLSEAQQGAKLIEVTFDAVSTVVWGMFKAGLGLQILKLLTGWTSWLFGTVEDGRKAFNDIKKEIGGLIKDVIGFINELTGLWSLEDAQKGAKYIEAIFTAVSITVWGMFKAGLGLQILNTLQGWTSWLFGTIGDGRKAFNDIKKEVGALVKDVIGFINELTGLWSLEDAQKGALYIAAVFNAVGTTVWGMFRAAVGLQILNTLQGWASWLFGTVEDGRKAFNAIKKQVSLLIYDIIMFINDLASIWSLDDAEKAAKYIKAVFKAVAVTVQGIIDSASTMRYLAMLTGVSKFFKVSLLDGADAIDKVLPPVKKFAKTIAEFGQEIGKLMSIDDAKDISIIMKEIGKISTNLAETIKTMIEQLVPLTRVGIFVKKAPIEKLKEVGEKVKEYFPGIADFIKKGVMDPINKNFDDIDDVKEVSAKMTALASMIGKLPDVFNTLINSIVPLMKGGIFSKAPYKKLDEVKWDFFKFMWATAAFIRLGIVAPINTFFDDVDDLKEVEQKLTALTSMISKIPEMFGALVNGIVPVMKGGFFTKAPYKKIEEVKWDFFKFMWATSSFIRLGIVAPVNMFFDDPAELNDVQKSLEAMAAMLGKLPPMFDALVNGIVPLMSGGWFSKAPSEKLNGEFRTKFEIFFKAIAGWLRQGIINPVQENFDDPAELQEVQASIDAMSKAISALPPMFNALVNGLVPMFSGGWFTKAPADKLNGEFRDKFSAFFWAIAFWLRCGIIEPIRYAFGDAKRLNEAKTSVEAMTGVVTSLPPMFDALVNGIVPLFSGGWFRRAPADKLNGEFREKFTTFFWAIANFLDEGIIRPTLEVLGNPKDMRIAADSLKATAEMLQALPGVINGVVDQVLPMKRMSKKMTKAGLFEDANVYKDFFYDLFWFLSDGIIDPVLGILGNPRDMQIAAQSLKATAEMLAALPLVINGVITQVLPMKRMSKKLQKAGLFEVSNVYRVFFEDLFWFLDEALITPILSILGNPRDMQIAAQSLKATAEMMQALPVVIEAVIRHVLPMKRIAKRLRKAGLLDVANVYKDFFIDLFYFLDEALITPILGILGNPRDMQIAAQSLKATADMMEALPRVIWGTIWATEGLNDCTGMLARLSGEVGTGAGMYKEFFLNLFNWLDTGIITPILEVLGDPRDMVLAGQTLKATADVMKSLPKFIADVASVTDQLAGGWWWGDSKLKKMGDSIKTFSDWFSGIAYGLGLGIFYPIKTYFPKPEEVEAAKTQLTEMVNVIKMLPRFIESMAQEIENIMNLPWWKDKDKIRNNAVVFSEFFAAIAYGLGTGIIQPIRTYFPDSSEFEEINARLDGVAEMLPKVRKVIDALMKEITGLGGEVGVYSKMLDTAWDVYRFVLFFGNIAHNIRYGIIQPTLQFPASRVIEEANGRLDAVAEMLPKVSKVITTLMNEIKSFGTMFKDWDGVLEAYFDARRFFVFFSAIARNINYGILWPIWNNFSDTRTMEEINGRLDAVAEMLPKVGMVIQGLMDEVEWFGTNLDDWDQTLATAPMEDFAKFFESVAMTINRGILWPVWLYFGNTKVMEEIAGRLDATARMMPMVGDVIENLTSQITRLQTAFDPSVDPNQLVGEFATFFKGVAEALSEGVITPVSELFPNPGELEGVVESLEALNVMLGSLDRVMATLTGTLQGMQGVSLDFGVLNQINVEDIKRVADFAEALGSLDADQMAALGNLGAISAVSTTALPDTEELSLTASAEQSALPNALNTGGTHSIPSIRPPSEGGELLSTGGQGGYVYDELGNLVPASGTIPQPPGSIQPTFGGLPQGGLDAALGAAQAQGSPDGAGVMGAAVNPDDFGNVVKLFVKKIRQTYRMVDVAQKKENVIIGRAQSEGVPGTGAGQQVSQGTGGLSTLLAKQMIPGGEESGVAEAAALKGTRRMDSGVGDAGGMTVQAPPKQTGGGFAESALTSVNSIQDSFDFDGMRELRGAVGEQGPQMTQFNATMLEVEDYLNNIEDMFSRCARIIDSFRRTAEFTEMFGKVGIYETMITQKIGTAKAFVPTIKRIAEAIGNGFDFSGGPELSELVLKQINDIKKLQVGLDDTEQYTTEIAKIFTTAQTILQKIKTTTDSLTVIENLQQMKDEVVAKVQAGNTLVGQIKEIATSFAASIDLSGINDLTAELQGHMASLASVETAMDLSDSFLSSVSNIATRAGQIQQTAATLGTQLRPGAAPAAPATPAPAIPAAPVAPPRPGSPAPVTPAPAPAQPSAAPTTADLMTVLREIKNILAPGAEEGSFYTHDIATVEALNSLREALVYAQRTTSTFSTQAITTANKQDSETQGMSINRAVSTSGQAAERAITATGDLVHTEVEGIPGTVRSSVETANETLSRNLTSELQGTRTALSQQINQTRTAPVAPAAAAQGAPRPPAPVGGTPNPNQTTQQLAQGSEAMQDLAQQGLTRGSIFTHDDNLAGILERQIVPRLMAVGANVAEPPTPTPTAQPSSPVDVHAEMQRRYATSQPGAQAAAPMDELGQIATLVGAQVGIAKEMLDELVKISAALEPSSVVAGGGGGNPVSTMTNAPPTVPPRYFRLTAGLFNQGATTGVLGANV